MMNLIEELTDLADAWRLEANDLQRNGLRESAEALRQCRTEVLALVKRAKREVAE